MVKATYDERFDKIDAQFERIDAQFERISVALIKGFDRIDNTLETKANSVDLQKALNILDDLSKRQKNL